MGYHPIVRKKTANHRRFPVVMFMNLRRNPSAYGMIPKPESSNDQKYRPRKRLNVRKIMIVSSMALYIASPAKKTIKMRRVWEFPL